MRRKATIFLHWTNLLLLFLLAASGPTAILGWLFVLSALAMCGIAIVKGLLSGPGPKLEGALRAAHPWLNRGMYLALGLVAGATALGLLGLLPETIRLGDLYVYLLTVGALHAVFQLWRHTALGDGALRRITPSSVHHIL